jgi:hypothetical protein
VTHIQQTHTYLDCRCLLLLVSYYSVIYLYAGQFLFHRCVVSINSLLFLGERCRDIFVIIVMLISLTTRRLVDNSTFEVSVVLGIGLCPPRMTCSIFLLLLLCSFHRMEAQRKFPFVLPAVHAAMDGGAATKAHPRSPAV